jgi:glycosyltransferase involved in cell wall biosynthesis
MKDMGKILLSHPGGNTFVRGLLHGLNSNNLLHSFHTSVACFEGDFLDRLASFPPFKDFRRRMFPCEVRDKTITYPYKELGRMFAQKFHIKKWLEHEQGKFCSDQVARYIDKRIANYLHKHLDVSGVYAYEDVAFSVFLEAKNSGIICLYDLPTGYWRAARELLNEKIDRYPAWRNTFTGFKDSEQKLSQKDKELELADVVYVAIRFTADTLKKYPGKLPPVKIIPYGFPLVLQEAKIRKPKGKIKLLFVGKLSQQKGIADIFEAVRGMEKHVELTIIGSKMDCDILKKEISRHNYLGTLPHNEVLTIMRKHDVLLFPSLFDGFGMVMTEAMSQGTPVIASDHSAGPDLIVHGENGWLMKAGSVLALRQQIESILEYPESLEAVGRAAMQTAKKRPWSRYGQEISESIQQFLHNV